jgi:hypothetical protein
MMDYLFGSWSMKARLAGKDFKERIESRPVGSEKEFNKIRLEMLPVAADHKGVITLWILFWPVSANRYLTHKVFMDFIGMIIGVYDVITKKAFGHVDHPGTKPTAEQ